MWKLIRGKSVWAINREPWSRHIEYLKAAGFRVVHQEVVSRPSKLAQRQLAARFRTGIEGDITTSEVLYQAVKDNTSH
jgi:hypothetical protein